jgi:hypothetical protein
MNDVEGVPRTCGTGLVDRRPVDRRALADHSANISARSIALFFIIVCGGGLGQAFSGIRPIFRERSKVMPGHRPLTESLAGVRDQGLPRRGRRARVFASGVGRLLENVMRSPDTISLMG